MTTDDENLLNELPQVPLEMEHLCQILEGLLFISDKPLTVAQLQKLIPQVDTTDLKSALQKIAATFAEGRGFRLVEVAGGYQFRTVQEISPWIRELVHTKPVRLSPAALEVLAIVAYRQPITRSGVEEIRGVDCGATIHTLLDRQLIKMIGKSDEPGHPLLYTTTKKFLEIFELKSLANLPALKEFQELTPEESAQINLLKPLDAGDVTLADVQEGFLDPTPTSEGSDGQLH